LSNLFVIRTRTYTLLYYKRFYIAVKEGTRGYTINLRV